MSVEIAAILRTLPWEGADGAGLREVVQLAADMCGTRWAAVTVRDGNEFVLLHSEHRLSSPVIASQSVCQHFTQVDEVSVVEDALLEETLKTSPFVNDSEEGIRFYATAPLHSDSGIFGRLCVFDSVPGDLDAAQRRSLEVLARAVSAMLELRCAREAGTVLAAAEGEIARIAAEISHDMRAPLASILGSVELLSDLPDLGIETRADMLRRAGRAGERLSSMVQQLLAFHRAGETTDRSHVDLDEVARRLVADLEPEFSSTGAKVRVHPLPIVSGDPYQLAALLLNLVTNALKFARPGVPAEVDIRSSGSGTMRRIHVCDNGIGIPHDKHQQVFRMFDRANTRIEGHGIGLATARRIVRAHGGDIGIRSEGQSGTEVWFDLKLATDAPPRQRQPE